MIKQDIIGIKFVGGTKRLFFESDQRVWHNKGTKRHRESVESNHEIVSETEEKTLFDKHHEMSIHLSCDCTFYSLHAKNNKLCSHIVSMLKEIVKVDGDLEKIE